MPKFVPTSGFFLIEVYLGKVPTQCWALLKDSLLPSVGYSLEMNFWDCGIGCVTFLSNKYESWSKSKNGLSGLPHVWATWSYEGRDWFNISFREEACVGPTAFDNKDNEVKEDRKLALRSNNFYNLAIFKYSLI